MPEQSARHRLLQQLTDGETHSGEALGKALGLSRAAVWKHIQAIQALGLDCCAVRGKGYRLTQPLELLDTAQIKACLSPPVAQNLQLHCFDELPSTNDYLMKRLEPQSHSPQACLAERQTQGRGRRGRQWLTPYGTALAFSLLWRFSRPASELSGLSLMVGIELVKALQAFGLTGIQLKWPNDLVSRNRKLGGILIEIAGDASGPCYAVIGVGLNMQLHQAQQTVLQQLDQPYCDMTPFGPMPSRNRLVACLLDNLVLALPRFEQHGFASFSAQWPAYDALLDREIQVLQGDSTQYGIAAGVDALGYLLLKTGSQLIRVISGDVSVRAQ